MAGHDLPVFLLHSLGQHLLAVLAQILRPDIFQPIQLLLQRGMQGVDLGQHRALTIQQQAGPLAHVPQTALQPGGAHTDDAGLKAPDVIAAAFTQRAVHRHMLCAAAVPGRHRHRKRLEIVS